MNLGKKYFISTVLVVYLISWLLQSVFFVTTQTYAENPQDETKLVALFVDDAIYDDIKGDVEWYAQSYIQGKDALSRYAALPNAKVLVFPINTKTFQAKDIVKLLENLYFEGIKDEPSKLVGTILIGDIPLPVIADNGTLYPSIFPYVDFEEQKFIWNNEQQYFVPNNNPNGQAETRHGWITYDSIADYHAYFSKLKAYVNNPSAFVDKNIWYDDFVDTQNNFSLEGVPSYVNNFLFAEDLVYHRYTNLMYQILQSQNNASLSALLGDIEGMDELTASQESTNIPTMTLAKTIKEGFLKSYSELIGKKQLVRTRDNIKAAGRWIEDSVVGGENKERLALDSHYYKIEQKDDVLLRAESDLQPALVAINEALESIVNEKIEKEQYYMTVPILTTHNDRASSEEKKWSVYTNYYFGTKAEDISSPDQLSIYRGTYLNLRSITGLSVTNPLKSIGGSYNIFSQQIQANRGFNVLNSQQDATLFNPEDEGGKIFDSSYYGGEKIVNAWKLKNGKWKEKNNKKWTNVVSVAEGCSDSDDDETNNCKEKGTHENGQDIINKNRGGATPLNLDQSGISLGVYDFKIYFYKDAWKPLYDIAGSANISSKEENAYSYSGYTTYASVMKTHVDDGKLAYLYPRALTEDGDTIDQATPYYTSGGRIGFVHKQTKDYAGLDFFAQYPYATSTSQQLSGKTFVLKNGDVGDGVSKYEYAYKLLDSRVYNISPTPEQINGKLEYHFAGSNSPVQQFYEEMTDFLDAKQEEVTTTITTPTQKIISGVQQLISTVNTYGGAITGYLQTIVVNSGALAASGGYVQSLAYVGSNIITGATTTTITTLKNSIRNEQKIIYEYLLDSWVQQQRFGIVLSNTYASSLSFNGLQSIIYTYQIQNNSIKNGLLSITPNPSITLLDEWVTDIKTQMQEIKQEVDQLSGYHTWVKTEIPGLIIKNNQLISQLTTGKNTIQTWKSCSGNSGAWQHSCGCLSGEYYTTPGYYAPICTSISELTGELTSLTTLISSILTDTVVRTGTRENINMLGDEIDETEFTYITTPVAEIDSGIVYHYSFVAPLSFLNFLTPRNSSGFISSYVTLLDTINAFTIATGDYLEKKGGMTEITQDRPVDAIRNITFKGIGNNVVEFQYPNLYKVNVYKYDGNSADTLILKTPDQIAEAIRSYLRAVEASYNQKLTIEKANSNTYKNQYASQFSYLETIDPLASPDVANRPYAYFAEGELEDALYEKLAESPFFSDNMGDMNPIDLIAQLLYYQNISWKERPTPELITDDITQTQNTVDINEKISNVLSTYLVKDQDKGSFITPEYHQNGYEVAFLNSAGADYISVKESPAFVQQLKKATAITSTPSSPVDVDEITSEIDQECGVNTDGSVDLIDLTDMSSPWLKAFACWLENIKTKPITFAFDRSNAQGPALNLDNTWGQELFWNQEETVVEQYQNYGFSNTDEENETIIGSLPGTVDGAKLNDIGGYTQFKANESSRNVQNKTGSLTISSTKSFGKVDFYLSSTGDSCIRIYNGGSLLTSNACTTTGKLSLNPIGSTTLPIELVSTKAGISVVTLQMCLPATSYCLSKMIKVDILPGPIQQTSITPLSSYILAGVPFSLDVKGTDAYGNNVGQLVQESFVLSVNTGTLTNGGTPTTSVRFNNFNDATFTYLSEPQTPNNTIATFTITGSYTTTLSLPIIQSKLSITSSLTGWNQSQQTGSLSFGLPNTEYTYKSKDEYGIVQVHKTALPKIRVSLKDLGGNILEGKTLVSVSSKNNLVYLGTMSSELKTVQTGGRTLQIPQERFEKSSLITIQSGWVDIYLYPSFTVGDDIITIQLPGKEALQIPLHVYPGDAERVLISTEKEVLTTNGHCSGSLIVTDAWNNIITTPTYVKLGTIGTVGITGFTGASATIAVHSGTYNFNVSASFKGGEGTVFALISGLQMSEQTPGYKNITVQNTIIPETGLNIMYLNLFGNDWGNQRGYFSNNDQYVEGLMKRSDKIITTTTQLISPEKLKPMSVLLDAHGKIVNFDTRDIFLDTTPTTLSYIINDVGRITVTNNFSLQPIIGEEEEVLTIIDSFEAGSYANKNVIYYIPEPTDSIVSSNEVIDNRIVVNQNTAFDLAAGIGSGFIVQLQDTTLGTYQTWTLTTDQGTLVGTLILRANKPGTFINEDTIPAQLTIPSAQYAATLTWSAGSTNAEQAIGIYDITSSYTPSSKGYLSIEDSNDPELTIGFRADFKNITLFGGGKSVGESTLPFGSEFLINLGDPLLKRIDENKSITLTNDNGDIIRDTKFDGGLDENIYSEPGKTIFKVMPIDFNKDNLQDILVVFTDGTVKILKNYGGKNPFTQMGNLMVFADGIKDIIIGDADGNGYDDIILRTKGDQLRIYKNTYGIFDVDGYPVCLNTNVKEGEINPNPSDLSAVEQVFLKDMNKDSFLDIVTNDVYGYVKIFYGGSNNAQNKPNYISTIKYTCDDDWATRQLLSNGGKNVQIVTRFGVRIDETNKVMDESLVRWKGIEQELLLMQQLTEAENLGITIDADTSAIDEYVNSTDEVDQGVLSSLISNLTSGIGGNNFDLSAMVEGSKNIYAKYKDDPFKNTPRYETSTGTLSYALMSYLTDDDPIETYKTYEDLNGDILEPGDSVQVTVHLKALKTFTGTFADRINGPWIVPTFEDNSMRYFWFATGYATDEYISTLDFKWIMDDGYYLIDNITLPKDKVLEWNYILTYQGDDTITKIAIEDITGSLYKDLQGEPLSAYTQDKLPDIKVYPTDSCSKALFVFFNTRNVTTNYKGYKQEFIDLMKPIVEYNQKAEETLTNAMSAIQNTISDFSTNADTTSISGMNTLFESRNPTSLFGDVADIDLSSFFSFDISEGLDISNMVNAPMQILDSVLGGVNDKIDTLMGSLCNGIKLGGDGCSLLPIPFNQAFLAPGKYHVFGCQTFDLSPIDKGIPALSFPGNRGPTAAGYIPAPLIFGFPFRGPTDDFFGGPKAGPNSSMVRLYLSPTLTMQLGIAMCFGPYTLGEKIPKPFNAIGGNCVVAAIPMPLSCNQNTNPTDTQAIATELTEAGAMGTCSSSPGPSSTEEGHTPSPFQMVHTAGTSHTPTLSIPDGSYVAGFITLTKEPSFDSSPNGGSISLDGVSLKGGLQGVKNSIKGGNVKGIAKTFIQGWLDKQTKFILNNLTKMRIDIYFPKFADLFEGFDKLGDANTAYEKDACEAAGNTRNDANKTCVINAKKACENKGKEWKDGVGCVTPKKETQNTKGLQKLNAIAENSLLEREQFKDFSESFGNPFEKLEAMFQEVPLINLRTENITIKVPMITSDDIIAYTSMLQQWLKTNQAILEKWTTFFKSIFALCNNKNVDDITDLKKEYEDIIANLNSQISDLSAYLTQDETQVAQKEIASLQSRINNLKTFTKNYNLSKLGLYDFYEGCNGEYYIKLLRSEVGEVVPRAIYIEITPDSTPRMYTKGYTLVSDKKLLSGKTTISVKENPGESYTTDAPCLAKKFNTNKNACMEIFFNPNFRVALEGFITFQSNADLLIASVKQNIGILEQYKKFPFQLYEWIHVVDRYMSELSSLIKNFLGTLSIWMKTNATRYTQYVNAFITMMTVIQTYQIIPDFAMEWSKRCGSCTVDSYDMYSCILGLLCPENLLPVLPIPPLKIPNIYIDLSQISLGLDIKLPKFNFVPTQIAVPKLPNLPEPPTLTFSMSMNQLGSLGVSAVEEIMGGLNILQSFEMPAMPILPQPPELKPLPSFLPTVKLELPTLPPAPKIPALPNELSASMETAETIGKILCIVKSEIGLVGEEGVKAKIEQITQRDREVPFWDTFDKTPSWISNTAAFLQSGKDLLSSEQPLVGFDYEITSYVNLQYSFEGVYNVINDLSQVVNDSINIIHIEEGSQKAVNVIDTYSTSLTESGQALVNSGAALARMVLEEAGKVKEIGTMIESCIKDPTYNGSVTFLSETYTGCYDMEKLEWIYDSANERFTNFMKGYNDLKQKIQTTTMSGINIATDTVTKLFDEINVFNAKIKDAIQEAQKKDEQNKKIRERKLQDLYNKPLSYDTVSNDIGYTISDQENQATYDNNKQNMLAALQIAKENVTSSSLSEDIDTTINLLTTNWNIAAKTDVLDTTEKQIDSILQDYRVQTDTLASLIQTDYPKFLASIEDNTIAMVADEDEETIITAPLFTMNDTAKQLLLTTEETPIESYLDVQKTRAEGFSRALANTDATSLGIDETTYTQQKIYLEDVQRTIADALPGTSSITNSAVSTTAPRLAKASLTQSETVTKTSADTSKDQKLLAQSCPSCNGGSEEGAISSLLSTDVSSYINGIFVNGYSGDDQKKINVLNEDSLIKNIGNNYYLHDLNTDGNDDLIMRDSHNVYVKYYNQNNSFTSGTPNHWNSSYYAYRLSSPEDLLDDSNDGYITMGDIKVKVIDGAWEVKNFKMEGQSYDQITYSFKNSSTLGDNPDAYLIKMNNRVDIFHDKEGLADATNEELLDKKYVLVVPQGFAYTGTKISIDEGTYRIEQLLTGTIVAIKEYTSSQEKIQVVLQNLPRNRRYAQISPYQLDGSVLKKYGPRSNQTVAGVQIIGDELPPEPIITLYRPMTDEVVGTGEVLEGFIGTHYDLTIHWKDNAFLSGASIIDSDGYVRANKRIRNTTGDISLTGLFFTGDDSLSFTLLADDTNGNIESSRVTINISTPDITITDITKYTQGVEGITIPGSITAELSNDIDEGYVQFIRQRNSVWNALTGMNNGVATNSYPVAPKQVIITGGYYDMGNMIGLYLSNGTLFGEINPDNGTITILPMYQQRITTRVDLSSHLPIIQVIDTQENKTLFWIALPIKELVAIDAGNLLKANLTREEFGEFVGGWALSKEGTTLLYVGPTGTIYTDQQLFATVEFDKNNETITYHFQEQSGGPTVASVTVKILPF